jgi:hypothetical protein
MQLALLHHPAVASVAAFVAFVSTWPNFCGRQFLN